MASWAKCGPNLVWPTEFDTYELGFTLYHIPATQSCSGGEKLTSFFFFFTFFPLQDRKIEELKQSLLRYKKVQDMVMSVQGKKG